MFARRRCNLALRLEPVTWLNMLDEEKRTSFDALPVGIERGVHRLDDANDLETDGHHEIAADGPGFAAQKSAISTLRGSAAPICSETMSPVRYVSRYSPKDSGSRNATPLSKTRTRSVLVSS